MLGLLKNTALSILGRIPLIKKLVPEKYHKQTETKSRDDLESFHKEEVATGWQAINSRTNQRDWTSSPITKPRDISLENLNAEPTWDQVARKAIYEEVEALDPKILNKFSELDIAIEEHIRRLSPNPNAEINFSDDDEITKDNESSENVILGSAITALNTTIADFHISLERIQQTGMGEISAESYIALADLYRKLIKQYIDNSLSFALELNNRVLQRTINLDDYVNDYEVCRAFNANRKISKVVCEKAVKALIDSFDALPAVAIDTNNGPISVSDYIKLELAGDIETLYLASKFGVHSQKLVESVKESIQKINEEQAHISCRNISTFKSAIHGSVLLDPENINTQEIEIAQIDPKVTEDALQKLLRSIIQEFRLESVGTQNKAEEQELENISTGKYELAQLLTHSTDVENETINTINTIASDLNWSRLCVKPEEANLKISEHYDQLFNTNSRLGATHDETILGRTYNGQNIVDTLRLDGVDTTVMREHFERLVHELSLVALIDVLDSYRGNKTKDQLFTRHKNFNSAPWLKDFYQARVTEYESWIEPKDGRTPLEARSLAKELAYLGRKLHDISGSSNQLFEFDDMCSPERYNIIDAANALLKRAGALTDMGVISLHLDLFSNLFAYLREGQEHGLNEKELKQIKDIIEFLKKESMLINDEGKQVIAPAVDSAGKNEIGVEKNAHMNNIIGSRGFLLLNTPIIVKFLTQSLENDHKKHHDDNSIQQRNSILASLLFYILVKYLPRESSDIDSLKARATVFKTLTFLASKNNKYVPILYNKMLKQGLGSDDDLRSPHPDGKPGVFLDLSKDLEHKIKQYPQQLDAYHAALQEGDSKKAASLRPRIRLNDLLEIHMDIENYMKKFPGTIKEMEARLKSIHGMQGHLLMGSKDVIKTTLESDTATVVEFVKRQNNEELTMFTHKLLIDKAARLARMVLKNNIDEHGNLLIFDSHRNTIHALIELLIYSKQAAYLINRHGANKVQIRELASEPEHNKNIQTLSKLLKRRVALITNLDKREVEEFPGQSQAKKSLIELLKEPEFEFKPAIRNRFDWINVTKIRDEIQKAQEAQYSLVS